jgi:hypothetical protein
MSPDTSHPGKSHMHPEPGRDRLVTGYYFSRKQQDETALNFCGLSWCDDLLKTFRTHSQQDACVKYRKSLWMNQTNAKNAHIQITSKHKSNN